MVGDLPYMKQSPPFRSGRRTYVCEEISAPDGYVITDAAETVYLSGKDQDVITVTFGNDKMGSLLIVKKDAVTGTPISDVEFLVTDSDGSVIGNANGKYVTDSAGTIRIDGLTPGMTVIAREVRAKDGYILDDTPQSIKIKGIPPFYPKSRAYQPARRDNRK